MWGLGAHVIETGVEAASAVHVAALRRSPATAIPWPPTARACRAGPACPTCSCRPRPATRGGAWLQDTWQAAVACRCRAGCGSIAPASPARRCVSPRLSATFSPRRHHARHRRGWAATRRALATRSWRRATTCSTSRAPRPRALTSERAWQTSLGRRAPAGPRPLAQGRGLLQALHRRAHRPARTRGRAAGPRGPLRLPGGAAVRASRRIRSSPPCPTNDGQGRAVRLRRVPHPARRRQAHRLDQLHLGPRRTRGLRPPLSRSSTDRRHAFTMVSSYRADAALGGGGHDPHRLGLSAHGAARRARGRPRRHARPRRRRRHRRDPARPRRGAGCSCTRWTSAASPT